MKFVIVSLLITIAALSLIVEADKTQSKKLSKTLKNSHSESLNKMFFAAMMKRLAMANIDEDEGDEESDRERESWEDRDDEIVPDKILNKVHQTKAKKPLKKTVRVEKPLKKENHDINKSSKNQKSDKDSQKSSDKKSAAKAQLNDKICGKSAFSEHMTRIVGGQEATPHSLPWQVTLLIRRTYFNGKVSEHAYCGGSLISREWIATAAHCAKDKYPAEDMRIWLGSHDLTKQESSRVKRSVIKKIQNPHYNAPTTDYDIALLQLDKAVEFNEYVRPICLPEAQKRAIEGSQSLISGWGTLSFRGNTSPTLQVAVVPIVSRETCNSLRSYHGQITTRMLCAGYTEGGVDTCQGDSGGPLATQVKNSDKFELTGVVSWGAGCARQYKYGVYTDVSYFRDWIDKMVNQYSRL